MKTVFRSGGGFWNNVDVEITNYQFTDEFPSSKEAKKKAKGTSDFHSLFCIISARVDGAEEDTSTTLFVGDADAFDVSSDGRTLTPVDDGYVIGGGTSFAKFIASLDENTEDGVRSDDESVYNYEAMIGLRCRFVQQGLDDKEIADLKRRGKPVEKKSADGKTYPIRNLIVTNVYEGASKPAGRPGKTMPAAAPGVNRANGRATRAAVPDAVDVAETASVALLRYLEAAPKNVLALNKLKMKVLTDPTFKKDRKLSEEVVDWLADADNVASIGEVDFNAKTELVRLSA